MKQKTEVTQVHVACLGCYNEGRTQGQWYDADDLQERWDYAEEHDRRDRVGHFNACPRPFHEEWTIHGYWSVPDLGEHPDIPYLIKVMRCIEEHGEPFYEWFNLDPHNKSHHDDLSEAFEEAYCGEHESPKAFAEQMAEDLGLLPHDGGAQNPLFRFVDFDWWWKSDLRHSYDYIGGFVFRSDV